MKLADFNNKYSKACDKVYSTVGHKEYYKKKYAIKMSKRALKIMANEFGISMSLISEHELRIAEILNDYTFTLFKAQGFDGILLSCAFAALEGTGMERPGFGKWLMFRSIFLSGIKSSENIVNRPNKAVQRSP